MKKQTMVVDLETVLQLDAQWSQNLFQKTITGFKATEMMIIASGAGKSMYYEKSFWADSNLCKEIVMPPKPKSKYKFSRAKWYTVDIGIGSWKLGREYNDIIAWCNETFGPHPKKQDAWSRWWVGIGQIYFRDERDLVLYKLRWT